MRDLKGAVVREVSFDDDKYPWEIVLELPDGATATVQPGCETLHERWLVVRVSGE